MVNFEGKNVVITGAAQGIGLKLVEDFVKNGATVIGVDVKDSVKNIEQLKLNYSGKAIGIQKDLSVNKNIHELCEEILALSNQKIDVLINNAGVIIRGDILELDEHHWDLTMKVNLYSTYLLCKKIAPSMIKNGGGKIINLASILSILGGYRAAAYSASKGAILQLTKSLANEWGQHNIQVNCIAPGYLNTEMNLSIINSERRKEFEDRIPANRWGTPDDLVGPTFFLASSFSNYVNGIILHVDGGALNR